MPERELAREIPIPPALIGNKIIILPAFAYNEEEKESEESKRLIEEEQKQSIQQVADVQQELKDVDNDEEGSLPGEAS